MDPVSNLAQAHAAAVLHHMMNGGMGAPMPAWRGPVGYPPPPYVDPSPILTGQPNQPHPFFQNPVHTGLLHLLGLGGHDYTGGAPRQPIQPSPGPGFGGPILIPVGTTQGPTGPPANATPEQLAQYYHILQVQRIAQLGGNPGQAGSGLSHPLSIKAWNA